MRLKQEEKLLREALRTYRILKLISLECVLEEWMREKGYLRMSRNRHEEFSVSCDRFKKYLSIAGHAPFAAVPMPDMDAVWHACQKDEAFYEQLTRALFGRVLNHKPFDGSSGMKARVDRSRETTKTIYNLAFSDHRSNSYEDGAWTQVVYNYDELGCWCCP